MPKIHIHRRDNVTQLLWILFVALPALFVLAESALAAPAPVRCELCCATPGYCCLCAEDDPSQNIPGVCIEMPMSGRASCSIASGSGHVYCSIGGCDPE